MDKLDIRICNLCGTIYDSNRSNQDECLLCKNKTIIKKDFHGQIEKIDYYFKEKTIIID